jgi:hypothetical protein
MDVNRTRMVLGVIVGLAAVFALAGTAGANTVTYSGEAKNLKPGQTKGLPVLIGFELSGKKCPKGPKCFKHAKIQNFEAVSFAWPNCPDVLDTDFSELTAIPVKKNRKFEGSGTGPDPSGFPTDVTLHGRFKKKGKSATGGFTATLDICSSDEITWEATPD